MSFMCDGGSYLSVSSLEARGVMALFNVVVRVGTKGAYSFCVGGSVVWEVHHSSLCGEMSYHTCFSQLMLLSICLVDCCLLWHFLCWGKGFVVGTLLHFFVLICY